MKTQQNGEEVLFEEILAGTPPPIKLRHARVPTNKVRLDAANPRLKYKKELHPDKSLRDLLFEEPDTNWLLKDIEHNGVLDPIYVVQLEDGWWKATEGNRRTVVMQALQLKHPENPAFAYIPARVLPENTTPVQEALLMASCHVAGKVKWQAHEIAGHIWHMLNVLHIPQSELILILHKGAAAIKKAAESYGMLEHFKRVDGGKYAAAADGKWSFFAEMFKDKELVAKHTTEGQDWDDQFCRWVGEGRIPKAEDVRDLAEILKKTKTRGLFENEPVEVAFERAQREMKKSHPSRDSAFFKNIEKLIASCKASTLLDQEAVKTNDTAREQVLEAYSVLGLFIESAGLRVPGTPRR